MLNDKQILRMLRKLKRFEELLDSMIFEKVCELPVLAYQTEESLYEIPDKSLYHPVQPGDMWAAKAHIAGLNLTIPYRKNMRDVRCTCVRKWAVMRQCCG